MLQAAQGAIGIGSGAAHGGGQQAGILGALQQGDIAFVVQQLGVVFGVRQHQILHGKFAIDHAARAVLEIKKTGGHFVRGLHALAHGLNFLA